MQDALVQLLSTLQLMRISTYFLIIYIYIYIVYIIVYIYIYSLSREIAKAIYISDHSPNPGLASDSEPRGSLSWPGQVDCPVHGLSTGSLLGPDVKSRGGGREFCMYTLT